MPSTPATARAATAKDNGGVIAGGLDDSAGRSGDGVRSGRNGLMTLEAAALFWAALLTATLVLVLLSVVVVGEPQQRQNRYPLRC